MVVAPLVAKIMLGFAGVNMLLSLALAGSQYVYYPPLIVAPNVLTMQLWAAAFGLLGALMLYAYIRNNWKLMRRTLVCGITFKFAWAIALGVRYVTVQNASPVLLVIWLFFAYIQIVTYVHFVPLPDQSGGRDARP